MKNTKDNWNSGDQYEFFMGRWSKLMAQKFLTWLDVSNNLTWLDLGCGTGALSEEIKKHYNPLRLTCIDPSEEFLKKAKEKFSDETEFTIGYSSQIPSEDNSFDIVASGLSFNFFPDHDKAISEIKRVLKPGGIFAAYVWDYAGRMDFLRYFWDAAGKIDPDSRGSDEGVRFPICNPDNLKSAFVNTGFSNADTAVLDIETIFKDFNDYWNPFLSGQGPAPGYLMSLSEKKRDELKKELYRILQFDSDGTLKLLARSYALKAVKI